MSARALELRMASLEQQLAALQARVDRIVPEANWERSVGMFADDDELMKRIDAAGQAIRARDRAGGPAALVIETESAGMIVLDTDHLSVLKYRGNPRTERLVARMRATPDEVFVTTIVNVEEQMRGWLAEIHRIRDARMQIVAYERLGGLFDFFANFQKLPFDALAAERFQELRRQCPRVGVMDVKIAAFALVHDARVLTGNARDFQRIPGLKVENWLN